jgi:hypothetical protein
MLLTRLKLARELFLAVDFVVVGVAALGIAAR